MPSISQSLCSVSTSHLLVPPAGTNRFSGCWPHISGTTCWPMWRLPSCCPHYTRDWKPISFQSHFPVTPVNKMTSTSYFITWNSAYIDIASHCICTSHSAHFKHIIPSSSSSTNVTVVKLTKGVNDCNDGSTVPNNEERISPLQS